MTDELPPFEVRRYGTVGSTNEVAREIASGSAAAGVLVVADRQTCGRGRRGRTWFSPAGAGFWGTLILRPAIDGKALLPLGLAAAVAVCETLESEHGLAPAIRWPNDLMLDGRKFGGILAEAVRSADGLDAVLLGMGVNLNAPDGGFPAELRVRAVALGETLGRTVGPEAFTAAFIPWLRKALVRACAGGFEVAREGYSSRSDLLGRDLSLELDAGPLRGRAVDFGPFGELVLRTEEGTLRTLTHGEVVRVWR